MSAFILAATGLTVLFRGPCRARIAGAFYALVTIAVPVGCLAYAEADMRALAPSRPSPFAATIVVYLLAVSAAGMALLVHGTVAGRSSQKGSRWRSRKGVFPASLYVFHGLTLVHGQRGACLRRCSLGATR